MRAACLLPVVALALSVAALCSAGEAFRLRDDFSRYAAGSDGSPSWTAEGIEWEVANGRYRATALGRDFAFPAKAPYAKRVAVEATIILRKAQTKEWKTAGAVPVFHEGFEHEVPVRYDLQLDGLCYLDRVEPCLPMVIVHGSHDTTVPTEHSREYTARFPDQVQLLEVDADHDLNGHMEQIWGLVESFLLDA